MTGTVLLRCAGPMQSWGTRSRFSDRDTEREPSKSGVIGLVASALGRRRDEPIHDLAALRMSVRIDKPGQLASDYQTAQELGQESGRAILSRRFYLADASFLVALEGDADLCSAIHMALRRPRWPLFLGRKSYVPGCPLHVRDGYQPRAALELLARIEWPQGNDELPVVVECGPGQDGDPRLDSPVSFAWGRRTFAVRRVTRTVVARGEAE